MNAENSSALMPSSSPPAKADIDHRLTKPKHPWTNGQVERMNRTLKEATVKRFYYETHEHFRQHLTDFVQAYNFARRLKTLKGLTPYEFICAIWTKEPQRFTLNPTHLTLGPYTYRTQLALLLPARTRRCAPDVPTSLHLMGIDRLQSPLPSTMD